MDNQQVGKFIAQLRKSKGMTQEVLAEKIGVTDKAVSKWERGLGIPDVSILPSLADTLDVTMEEILSGVQTSQIVSIIEVESDTENTTEIESIPKAPITTSFFKKKLVRVIFFTQAAQTAFIGLIALTSLLYAKEMGVAAIADTLKGLLASWLIIVGVFGILPLLLCYIWDVISSRKRPEQ